MEVFWFYAILELTKGDIMEIIKEANKIIKDGIALLPDDAKTDYKTQTGEIFINEAIGNAMAMVNEDPEREALLGAYAVQEANRVITTLWREKLLPEDLEKEYRSLPTMKEMADAYNKFTSERQERMDDVMAQHRAIAEEEKDLDIFKGVINGMSKKEAERKYEEFKNAQQQAITGGR